MFWINWRARGNRLFHKADISLRIKCFQSTVAMKVLGGTRRLGWESVLMDIFSGGGPRYLKYIHLYEYQHSKPGTFLFLYIWWLPGWMAGPATPVSQIIKVSSFSVFCWMQMTLNLRLTLSKNFTHWRFILVLSVYSFQFRYIQMDFWWLLWSHSIVNMGKTRCERYFLIVPLSDVKINDHSWCKLQPRSL